MKIRGYRIELGEIEARLAAHSGVREAVVVAREEEGGGKRLEAYYTGEEVGASEMREHVAGVLPDYMVPAAYVHLEALPLTANGKLDRGALPAAAGDAYARREYEEPVGEIESAVARIWGELLRVERVSRNDNFFELGGHSLLAVQVMSRLRQEVGVEVALAGCSRARYWPICADGGAKCASRTAAYQESGSQGLLEVSFAQQRLWFLSQFEGASEAYHIAGGVRLIGELDRGRCGERWIGSWSGTRCCGHVFKQVEGVPVQVIGPAEGGFMLAEDDLRRGG